MSKKKKDKTQYEKDRQKYRKESPRHVLVLEAVMEESLKRQIFADANIVRMCGNELTYIMNTRLEQLFRTKKYRHLLRLWNKYRDNKPEQEKIAHQMNEMRVQYGVTWDECRLLMQNIRKEYNAPSVFALTKAESIWEGVESILFGKGEELNFKKRGDLPALQAKQISRAIVISLKDGNLNFSYNKISFTCKPGDRFITEETEAIINYLKNPHKEDMYAVKDYIETGNISDTFRPCYASLVVKNIRGKKRVFIHITIEGHAKQKYRKDGSPRHTYGTGVIGCDIGTQTIAYVSGGCIGLENLAERGKNTFSLEREERRLKRAMDRSRRATNPDNYNEDGTIKKGKKVWRYSKRYIRIRNRYREFCRINAENRHLAINETVNKLRSLGNVFVTEGKNSAKLQKKANPGKKDKNGRPAKRKRWGKSNQRRCPGYFQAKAQRVFSMPGTLYTEVGNDYRASQYDHPSDSYIKKKLSDRMYNLSDGITVQRDLYSALILHSCNSEEITINKPAMSERFKTFLPQQEILVKHIKDNRIYILNSGIKIKPAL